MKRLVFFVTFILSTLNLAAETLETVDTSGSNPMANPFAASPKLELPPLPAFKPSGVELPPVATLPKVAQQLPQNLRVILIRDQGHGLLGSTDAGFLSIPVASGKTVRIAGQNYYVQVTAMEISLYTAQKGSLVWTGSLGGVAPPTIQVDMSQMQYIPPLSAGVNPGLQNRALSGGATSGGMPATSQPVIRSLGSQ